MNKLLIKLLINATYKAYSLSLNQYNIESFQDINNPVKNNYVMEISSLRRRDMDEIRIGKLLSDINETFEDNRIEIELLDGTIQKWGNCKFIKIPSKLFNNENI